MALSEFQRNSLKHKLFFNQLDDFKLAAFGYYEKSHIFILNILEKL